MSEIIKHSVHTGKLDGFISFSCDKFINSYCLKMSKNKNVICNKCYVDFLYRFYGKKLENKLKMNSKLLMNKNFIIPKIPKKYKYIRFNSFGELHNITHLNNLIKIVNAYPDKNFTLWSKRKDIIKKYFNKNVIPDNLILIYSYTKIADSFIRPSIPSYFHKMFIVISNDDISLNNVNCNAKCKNCMKCYIKNDIKYIYEKIKEKKSKIKK